jgi:hypothetical protein
MSGDELIVTAASLIFGLGGWAFWLYRASSFDALRPRHRPVGILAASVGVAGLLVLVVLRVLAADDVRDAPQYLAMYFVMGLAWMRLTALGFPLAGLSPRDDLIERGNSAAVPAWTGAVWGVACCYAGGNVGNGPGWWVVVFSAALATGGLAAVWLLVAQRTALAEAVTVDRDRAAGIRLGGLLLACGLIFGSAVMGDWVSARATVVDFALRAWPVIPIVLVAIVNESVQRPTPARPQAPIVQGGILPAAIYVALAVLVVGYVNGVVG